MVIFPLSHAFPLRDNCPKYSRIKSISKKLKIWQGLVRITCIISSNVIVIIQFTNIIGITVLVEFFHCRCHQFTQINIIFTECNLYDYKSNSNENYSGFFPHFFFLFVSSGNLIRSNELNTYENRLDCDNWDNLNHDRS